MDYCSACPRLCQSACPVAMTGGNESHSPWGLMQTMNLVRKGVVEFDKKAAALSYQCLTCRACTTQCEHGNVIPPVLMEARKKAVELDLAPPEITGFLAKFHKYNNPFAKDLLYRLKQIVPSSCFEGDPSTIYYPSCTTIAKAPEVIRDTFDLFSKLKIEFVGVFPETIQCCGYPLLTAGMEDDFIDLAEINFHALKKYKTVVSGSPACVYTLQDIYPQYALGLNAKVLTINQFLEPYLHNINYTVRKNIRTKLMFHDPCYLSRYLKETELPRELIGQVSGVPPLEFYNHGEKGVCSGQGGCFSVVSKKISDAITHRHLEEVYDRGVQMVVTQCPSCVYKFKKNSKGLIIKDLVSYLNDCIEGSKD